MERVAAFLFRHRGLVPVLPIAIALVWAEPRAPWLGIGIAAMAAGEGVRLWGTAHLGMTARSRTPQAGKLVTRGPYAHTRHPLYWGNLLISAGFAAATGAGWPWFPGGVGILFAALYSRHALREEAALAAAHPEPYAAYRSRVPRWRWRAAPARVSDAGDPGEPSLRRAIRVEAETINAEVLLLAALWVRERVL